MASASLSLSTVAAFVSIALTNNGGNISGHFVLLPAVAQQNMQVFGVVEGLVCAAICSHLGLRLLRVAPQAPLPATLEAGRFDIPNILVSFSLTFVCRILSGLSSHNSWMQRCCRQSMHQLGGGVLAMMWLPSPSSPGHGVSLFRYPLTRQ